MGGEREKAFLPLLGKPLLAWTLLVFQESSRIDQLIVVVPAGCERVCRDEVVKPYRITKALIVAGGRERQDSFSTASRSLESHATS